MATHIGASHNGLKELYLTFTQDSHTHILKWIQSGSSEIISYYHMGKLLKKDHSCMIAQFHAIQVLNNPTPEIHTDLHIVLDKHLQVFETPTTLPPSRGYHDNGITLILGSQLLNVHHNQHPFVQKKEIQKLS